jgi:putative transposase
MVWRETCVMDERLRFVLAVAAGEEAVAALCRRFGVSRRIGYKWLGRYREAGVAGLEDRSRAPLSHPQAVAAAIAERCLAVRRAHPTWGPLKVRAWLERQQPQVGWPAASTIGALFDREGLTVKRRPRRRGPPASAPFAACGAANDVWCIDFKGWFLTGDGSHCEPLTLSDAHSRYLLRCQAVGRADTEHVWPILDAALREYGLPLALRSDNGAPFASTGAGGLSRLAVLVLKAGVRPERIAPGQAAAERPPRAPAPDPVAGHREPAGAQPAPAARPLPRLPAGLQRAAPAPGARQHAARRPLPRLPAPLGRRAARTRLCRRAPGAPRPPQR